MDAHGLPAALPLLKSEPSPAVDDALLEALPQVSPAVQRAILEVLVERGRAHAGVALLRGFAATPADLQSLILEYAPFLYSPLRSLITSNDFEDRRLAVEFVTTAFDTRSAYLLAEALRQRCRRTRELAAKALVQMTETALEAYASQETGRVKMSARLDELAAGLSTAIRLWEVHLQPAVLEAGLRLIDRTAPAFRAKLSETRSRLADAVSNVFSGPVKAGLAGSALRCLAIPELRSTVGACIARAQDRTFVDTLFAEAAVAADPVVQHGCRFVHKDRFETPWVESLLSIKEDRIPAALNLVASLGGTAQARVELYKELLRRGSRPMLRSVIWRLVEDESEAAAQILTALAARQGDELALTARRECRRRELGSHVGPAAVPSARGPHSVGLQDEARMARGSGAESSEATSGLLDIPVLPPDAATAPPEPPLTRSQARTAPELLRSPSATERLSGLMRLPAEGDVKPMAEVVYRLCMDVDAGVRAAAVALLPQLPGTVSARLLKKALNDSEPRVQANAIEALDALGLPDRGALISAKLNSPDNRVRANAVKSCLRAEMYQAAEVLLEMLESESAAHRISGLWVVERLQLGSVVTKVEQMVKGDADEQVRARARAVCDRLAARRTVTTGVRGLQPAR